MKERESPKKVHKLKVDTRFPFRTFGISCHENDYRMIWAINTKLNTNFVRTSDFVDYHEAGEEKQFSRFVCEDADRCLSFFILSNRCDNGYLVPEYRKVDYFLFVKGEPEAGFDKAMLDKLKQVDILSMAFFIDNRTLRSAKKLLHIDA